MSEMKNFDEGTRGNIKASMKQSGADGGSASSSDLWNVDPRTLHVMPGFNRRQRSAKYLANVQRIKQSIIENGWYPEHPISILVLEEAGKLVNYVVGGHTRHEAVMEAMKEGHPIETITAISLPRGTSVEDMMVSQIQGNSGTPFDAYETALLIKDLMGLGLAEKRIAERLGYSTAQIKNILAVLELPKSVRDMVTDGKVAATEAVKFVKKHGSEAPARLKEGLKVAQAAGKTKVSGKHLKKLPTVKLRGTIDSITQSKSITISDKSMMRVVLLIEADDKFGLLADDTVELKLVKRNDEEI